MGRGPQGGEAHRHKVRPSPAATSSARQRRHQADRARRLGPARSGLAASAIEEEEIAPADLEGLYDDGNLLGRGAFGEVRKVFWRKTPAAVDI